MMIELCDFLIIKVTNGIGGIANGKISTVSGYHSPEVQHVTKTSDENHSLAKQKLESCKQHPKEQLELYCKQCQCLVCHRCFVNEHNGHPFGEANDSQTRKEIEDEMNSLITTVGSRLTGAQEHFEYMNKVEQDAMKRLDQIKDEIKQVFNPLIETLEKQRDKVQKDAEISCNKHLKEVWAQKERLETAIVKLKGTLDLAEQSIQCSDDQQFLQRGHKVIYRLKELTQTEYNPADPALTESLEIETIEFEHRELPSFDTIGNVAAGNGRPNLAISYTPPARTIYLGEEVKFEVEVALKINQKETKSKKHCKLDVKVTHGKAKLDIPNPPSIKDNGDDRKLVSFTPVVSGVHTVSMRAEIDFGKKSIEPATEEEIIKAIGTPRYGDKIHRGPDWDPKRDDQVEENEGKVIEVENTNKVKVKWNGGNHEATYKWGEDGEYEVQMAH